MENIEYKCVKFRPWVGANYKKGFHGKNSNSRRESLLQRK